MAPIASANDSPTTVEAGFDETLGALKQVVDKLESGQLSLEASLAAFESGVRLARQGAQILDAAERRVEVLTRGAKEGDAYAVEPFADGQDGAASPASAAPPTPSPRKP